MPAPRACRSCGSALSADVRWCVRCLAPVVEFAARPTAPGTFVDTPRHQVAYSRWAKTPTSFGPRGRIVATMLVVGFGPWTVFGGFQIANPFFLWYLLAYIPASIMVLKHIWVRVHVIGEEGAPPIGTPPVVQGRLAWLSRSIVIRPRAVLTLLGMMLIGSVAAIWFQGDGEARYAVVVLSTMTGVGVLLAWLSGI